MPWFLRILLVILPLLAIAYGYVGWRLGAAIGTLTSWPKAKVRRAIIAVIAFANLYVLTALVAQVFHLTALSQSLRGARPWSAWLAYPFWATLIFCAELLPFLLALDVVCLPLWSLFQRHKQRWLKYQAVLPVTIGVALAVYIGFRIVNDTFSLRLSSREVAIADLPHDLDGFRIVHLSDLQADAYTDAKKMQRYVDLANAQQPDLVLFSGDVVTSGTDYVTAGAEMMGKLRARLGVFACQGDHDYWSSRTLVAEELKRQGVHIYEDSVLTLSGSASTLSLTILTNVYQRRPSAEKLQELSEQRPEAAAHLLLTHQPTEAIVNFAENHGYNLAAAGHTHGGQVVFRFLGFPLNASMFETDYVSGFFQIGNTLLSVTNGLGLTIAPVRYQAPAEVTLLTLRNNAAQ